MCPVHKNGDLSSIKNYRPFKLYESVRNSFVQSSSVTGQPNIYAPHHSFVHGRSTVTNLVSFLAVDGLAHVDIIYTDFSKAFDRLDHGSLLNKFQTFGFIVAYYSFLDSPAELKTFCAVQPLQFDTIRVFCWIWCTTRFERWHTAFLNLRK